MPVLNTHNSMVSTQSYNSSNLNRSYSNSQDKSNVLITSRNTTGYVQTERPSYAKPPISYKKN